MLLNEDLELYKGIFWIVDLENLDNNRNYCFKIPSDVYGNPIDDNLDLNAKRGSTYNHKLVWDRLSRKLTRGKQYNYYPRGRIEIHNGVAKIFLNGNINREDVVDFLISEFNIIPHNGVKNIKIIEDNSQHYLCYLDKDWKEDR